MKPKALVKSALASIAAGLFSVAILGIPSQAQATPWFSVSADYDFTGECATDAIAIDAVPADAANPGGVSCFNKTIFVPFFANVLRVTWSTTGDTHGGAALQIGCVITRSGGAASFCNPIGTGAAPGFYITKSKLPTSGGVNNCGDGGGGTADCHDNSVNQIWCVQVPRGGGLLNIDLRIASNPEPGGPADQTVFVEASTFFIDWTRLRSNKCVQREAPLED